jgi:outer membrane lipoprotein-sorting protein
MSLDRRRLILLALGLPALAAAGGAARPLGAQSAEARGTQIVTEASARNDGYGDLTAAGEMTLRTGSGQTSTRRFDNSWIEISARESRSLLVFNWPGDIRNTALLTHTFEGQNDDQWLYLPAMERVRRISGSGRSGSFVGSEFAFEDMADQEIDKFDHAWVEDGPCPNGGGTCHVIDRFPRAGSGYSRQRIWLDTRELRLQQVQYFDRRGAHLKTLSITGYQQYLGRFWRAGRMDMVNHLTGASTRLTWSDYAFNRGLSADGFTVNALRRIR